MVGANPPPEPTEVTSFAPFSRVKKLPLLTHRVGSHLPSIKFSPPRLASHLPSIKDYPMPIFISPEQLHSAIRDISWSLPEDAYLAKGEDRMLTTGSKLPHSKIRGKLQHVTWRTHDSIPQEQVDLLLRRADQFRLTHPLPWDKPTETEYRNMPML